MGSGETNCQTIFRHFPAKNKGCFSSHESLKTVINFIATINASVDNSTSAYPPSQPRGICSGSLFRGWAFVHAVATPRKFDTPGFKTVKIPGRQVACFIPLR